jgi:hypothetical protein
MGFAKSKDRRAPTMGAEELEQPGLLANDLVN